MVLTAYLEGEKRRFPRPKIAKICQPTFQGLLSPKFSALWESRPDVGLKHAGGVPPRLEERPSTRPRDRRRSNARPLSPGGIGQDLAVDALRPKCGQDRCASGEESQNGPGAIRPLRLLLRLRVFLVHRLPRFLWLALTKIRPTQPFGWGLSMPVIAAGDVRMLLNFPNARKSCRRGARKAPIYWR